MHDMNSILVDFGTVAVGVVATKQVVISNNADKPQKYQVTYLYAVNNIDNSFVVYADLEEIKPGEDCSIRISFKPRVPEHYYIEYYLVSDNSNNLHKLILKGMCLGPKLVLDKNKIIFNIDNVTKERSRKIEIINWSAVDAQFQWFLPNSGLGMFQICTDHCGVVKANERVSATIAFTGTTAGSFAAELVCLVQHQKPLFLDVTGVFTSPGNPTQQAVKYLTYTPKNESYKRLMENCLNYLTYIPAASVFGRHLDFKTGSVEDMAANVSHTVCVTNQEDIEAQYYWLSDPEKIFIVEPVFATILPKTSKQFTVRFRPKMSGLSYGHLLCGFLQQDKYHRGKPKVKNTWFRLPCIGNTWRTCKDMRAQWECQAKIVMPPTIPGRVVFSNFTLTNKADTPMNFHFFAPERSNFVVMPMCGNILGRVWQIVCVAFHPNVSGYFCENWELLLNKTDTVRVLLYGSAELSYVEVMSQGYNPSTHAMLAFPATVTECSNHVVSHLRNTTRMYIHLRVLNNVTWLGGDNSGSIVLRPNEIVPYRWWFFPKTHNKVYETITTCSCVCLIDDKPVGETSEIFVNITGFSEYPNVKVLPKTLNLRDLIVGETAHFDLTLYNFGTCSLRLVLMYELIGMGENYDVDEIDFTPKSMDLQPSQHCEVKGTVVARGCGARQIGLKFRVLYHSDLGEIVSLERRKKNICTIWYDGIYPSVQVNRTLPVKSPIAFSGHCVWNFMNIEALNEALMRCRPKEPLSVSLFAPDLHEGAGSVEVVLVLGCAFDVEVPWTMKRKQLCDCKMMEVQLGISTFEKRHSCVHRPLVEITPMSGVVLPKAPLVLHIQFEYSVQGTNVLEFDLTLPNERILNLLMHITTCAADKGILTALRRPVNAPNYLAVMHCGRVPINNLDPVVRLVWLYNPTRAFATWRILRRSTHNKSAIQCILYFAEIPPLSRFAIPFAFLPTEMIDYEEEFSCSFGFQPVKILVKGQGGLPNCFESRLDIPRYIKRIAQLQHRHNMVWLSCEHMTISVMSTHSVTRELVALTNATNNVIRYIWLPERIANIINISMTPAWGILQPKATQWVTMSVYSFQEPATFTISVVCELLDLTARREYQRNELLRRNKREQCAQQFVITEHGLSFPEINDFPPYVLDLPSPTPSYIAISVAISSQGQRDGVRRFKLRQLLEQAPPYDLSSGNFEGCVKMPLSDVFRIIDGILWNALHSTMMKSQLQYYVKEEIPTCTQLMKSLHTSTGPGMSKRATSGICDAIVNQAVFEVYSLDPKHHMDILKLQ